VDLTVHTIWHLKSLKLRNKKEDSLWKKRDFFMFLSFHCQSLQFDDFEKRKKKFWTKTWRQAFSYIFASLALQHVRIFLDISQGSVK
jgi:hypothetical protein